VEMPSDPVALLALAAKRNGLQNAAAPWHVKATYQILDETGSVKETGTFEELWVSATKHKRIFSSPSFSQTDYSTENGRFRVGDPVPQGPVAAAQDSLFPFFPSDALLARSTLNVADRAIGSAQLRCVTLDTSKPGSIGYAEAYCFNSSAPILRLYELSRDGIQTLYNGIVQVRGSYLARDVLFSRQGKPQLRVHVDRIEGMPQINESDFIPPPTATPVKGPPEIGYGVMAGRVLYKVTPEYPETAKSIRTEGVVVLSAVIGKDGRIRDLRPISGPSVLIPPSLKAVNQWVYEPYLLDGEPVQVGTTINVVFSLGGGGFSPPK
jgi:hypothetical protein